MEQPDFATLKPVNSIPNIPNNNQPDFSTLKPVELTFSSQQNLQSPGLISRISSDLGQRKDDIVSAFANMNVEDKNRTNESLIDQVTGRPLHTIFSGLVQAAGGIAGGGLDILKEFTTSAIDKIKQSPNLFQTALGFVSPALQPIINTVGPKILDTAHTTLQKVLDSPVGQAGIDAIHKGQDAWTQYAQQNPEEAKTLSAVGNIISAALTAEGLKPAVEAIPTIGKEAITAGKEIFTGIKEALTNTPEVSDFVAKYYPKAIKPSIAGTKTATDIAIANEKVSSAVSSIIENKSNLVFGDETARLPKNVQEFGDAITQTKQSIYKQYNALTKEATGKGVSIDLKPISADLKTIADNPVIRDNNPELVKYAQDKANRLFVRGTYTPDQMEEAITNYNASLKAFYRNPTYDTASKAAVDAGIVGQMRQQLDTAIESVTGKEYQTLKNQYAALKSIENDVTKATLRIARKNPKGLLDFTDIASGAEAVRWIVSHNPADFASAGAMKAISLYQKYVNNPDIMIAKMFSKAEKVISP